MSLLCLSLFFEVFIVRVRPGLCLLVIWLCIRLFIVMRARPCLDPLLHRIGIQCLYLSGQSRLMKS